MQEAKYSLNLKFNFKGFDTQLTLRDDENCQALFTKLEQVITILGKSGATPERRWENAKNGREQKPTCPQCSLSDQVQLITWERNGKEHKAHKCQRCQKWLPKNGG